MRIRSYRQSIQALCSTVVLLSAAEASAQNPEAGDVAPPPGQYGVQGQVQGGWQPAPLPQQQLEPVDPGAGAMEPMPEPEAPPGSSDHAGVVGHFGIGFFGVQSLPLIACDSAACTMSGERELPAPTIGARYWLSEGLGIEAAIGLNVSSGSNGPLENSAFGFALHGGVPLALLHTGSFVFEVVPQLNFGIASGSYETTMPVAVKSDVSGFLFEIGIAAGAEIHFGFIDLPQLSLQGTIGLMLRSVSRSVELPSPVPGGAPIESEKSDLTIATTVSNAPWELFTQTITAIYYF